MRRFLLTAAAAAILLLAAMAGPGRAQDMNEPDTVYVDSVSAFASGAGVVPVYFFNDQDLLYVQVTLSVASPDVKIDSFSFAGSRVSGIGSPLARVLGADSTTVTAGAFSQSAIPAGNGLLGRMYISYPSSVDSQLIVIDSTTFSNPPDEFSTEMRTGELQGMPYVPQFKRGYLHILADPPSLDSLWIDQVVAKAGEEVSLDIHLYTERNIEYAQVALDYGAGLLHYVSVDIDSTMLGAEAQTRQFSHIDQVGKMILKFTFPDNTPLPPGTGTLARVTLLIDSLTAPQMVTVDSTTYFSEGPTLIRLTAIDGHNQITPIFRPGSVDVQIATGIDDDIVAELPVDFALEQNYPNPFNPTTTIQYSLPTAAEVRLDVFNLLGQRVTTLVDGYLPAGTHEVEFDGRDDGGGRVASGVYFYRLVAGDFAETKKMVFLK